MTQNPDSGFIDDDYVAFFKYVFALIKKAENNVGECQDRFIRIGDHQIKLHFIGEGLINALMPAVTHLEIPSAETPDLTIMLWDSASSGTGLPTILSRYFETLGEWWLHLGLRGEIKELTNDRIHTAYHLGPNIFSMIDLQENLALYWVKNAQDLPYYEMGSPLRTILHWQTNQWGYQFVHSGAIGQKDGGILIVGKGGSGKSTTSLACVDAGMCYVGDDYCLIKVDPEPYVNSVYNTVKLRNETDLDRFPHLVPLVSNKIRSENDKVMVFLHDHFPEKLCRGFPIKAILLPTITQEKETRIIPTTTGAILAALAPTTLFQLPGAGGAEIKTMSNLIRRVPGFILKLGTDITKIPPVIFRLLSDG